MPSFERMKIINILHFEINHTRQNRLPPLEILIYCHAINQTMHTYIHISPMDQYRRINNNSRSHFNAYTFLGPTSQPDSSFLNLCSDTNCNGPRFHNIPIYINISLIHRLSSPSPNSWKFWQHFLCNTESTWYTDTNSSIFLINQIYIQYPMQWYITISAWHRLLKVSHIYYRDTTQDNKSRTYLRIIFLVSPSNISQPKMIPNESSYTNLHIYIISMYMHVTTLLNYKSIWKLDRPT